MGFSSSDIISFRERINTLKKYNTLGTMDPPSDYNYDNYDDKGINRKRNNGLYPEIKLLSIEKPIGDIKAFSNALSDPQTIIVGDINLSLLRTKMDLIADTINNKNKHDVIILGNMIKQTGKYSLNNFGLIIDFLNELHSNHVHLILGENDKYALEAYIDLGFTYVTDRAEKTFRGKKIIYTHYPVKVGPDELNIHAGNDPVMMSRKGHWNASLERSKKVHTLQEITNTIYLSKNKSIFTLDGGEK